MTSLTINSFSRKRALLSCTAAALIMATCQQSVPACTRSDLLCALSAKNCRTGCIPDTITISLDANYTTPFKWSYTMSNEGVLEETCSRYVSDLNPTGLTGVGGTQYYTFKAVGDGTVTLNFSYNHVAHPDRESSPDRVYVFSVSNGVIKSSS